jgi:tagatose 1,6-diphosphate aldolase
MTKFATTIGKRRGLESTSTAEGVFAILAFDHRQSFVKMLNLDTVDDPYDEIVATKLDVIQYLAPHASAVLLDPLYSASQAIAQDALPAEIGLLVAIEETGYAGDPIARETRLLPDWGVGKVKRMGADAVKLLIYYHPDAGELTEKQERLTAQVIEACQVQDIAFFLEAVSYSTDLQIEKSSATFAAQKPDLIIRSARRLSTLKPDVLKLEFPIDVSHNPEEAAWLEACHAISEASQCPWTVLSAGVDFELFSRQVAIACQAGASGYIAGRAVWKEGIPMPTVSREKWLSQVAADRLDRLKEIATRSARSWKTFFPAERQKMDPNWYRAY